MRIYNGTNHSNTFFSIDKNNGRITKARNGIFFANGEVKPSFELIKQIPLETPRESANCFCFLENYEKFDMILCSRRFADYVRQNYEEIPQGFFDRLCVPIPLFADENGKEKIGCVGVKKACPALRSMCSYYEILRSDANPEEIAKIVSPFAVSVAIDEDIKNGNTNCVKNSRINELKWFLKEKGMKNFIEDNLRFFCV